MAQDLAREEFVLPSNACFGCGEANSHGLQVSIYRDPVAPNRLLGEFRPGPDLIGLPGVTHGGTIYTAAWPLGAGWCSQTKAMWVLRSAATTYHRPAVEGAPISLSASLEREGGDWEAIEVRVEARNAEGQLLAEGLFKVIPLPPDKFKALARMDEFPAGWSDWFEGRAQLING